MSSFPQVLKLTANGQDLGGALLFERRLGFSGTPSDLLPVEMGKCHFEDGDTAQVRQGGTGQGGRQAARRAVLAWE